MSAVQGDRGHDATDRGAPVKIGGKASSSAPADVAASDRVDAYFDLKGRQVVLIDTASTISLSVGDLEIGAVELKNATTDDRARIGAVSGVAAADLGLTVGSFAQGNVAHDAADAGGPVKIGGKASTAVPSAVSASADRVDAYFDEYGRQHLVASPVRPSGETPSNANSGSAYVASLVVKASAGVLYGLTGYNSKAAAQFIQVHSASALPADGAAPVVTFTVPASSNFSLDYSPYGRYCTPGIVISNSSTGPTKTIGAADIFVDVQYV